MLFEVGMGRQKERPPRWGEDGERTPEREAWLARRRENRKLMESKRLIQDIRLDAEAGRRRTAASKLRKLGIPEEEIARIPIRQGKVRQIWALSTVVKALNRLE